MNARAEIDLYDFRYDELDDLLGDLSDKQKIDLLEPIRMEDAHEIGMRFLAMVREFPRGDRCESAEQLMLDGRERGADMRGAR